MGQEIELKLSIRPTAVEAFRSHPVLSSLPSQSCTLENQYYDTPEQHLTQAGTALRLRFQEGHCVQTLKTRGSNIGGLHQRDEWEVERPDGQLDLSEFPAGVLPGEVTANQLVPLFTTGFNRHRWLVQHQGAEIEVVLDEGQVSAG
ncbi:MAG: CYTH domain-containing protein, partial [Saccharospirillum sp.]